MRACFSVWRGSSYPSEHFRSMLRVPAGLMRESHRDKKRLWRILITVNLGVVFVFHRHGAPSERIFTHTHINASYQV